ncbi:MAG TPA: aminoglycoside phosphotransferase family protein [Bryobacteraceae bacterium]|nr:aminoglycoside phosphotransferase family protein [Bryobacteraceae bacterium]
MVDTFVRLWDLTPDGTLLETRSSRLLPVRWRGLPAMLKIAVAEEEVRGGALMRWWEGEGAARVWERAGPATLLERATGEASLAEMAIGGRDDEASRLLCAAVQRLHAPRGGPMPDLVPLPHWFRSLATAAKEGGILARCAETAEGLLAERQEPVALHGDIHHGNVLDFGRRGWLAIDPKGLLGDRAFDYANLFCNPDPAWAVTPGRLARQACVVSESAGLERVRLLRWIVAWAGLSAAFLLEDNDLAYLPLTLQVAEMAAALEGA